MATTPLPDQSKMGSNLDQAFVADRAIFWGRFTNFVKYGCIAMVVLLVLLWLFVA